MNYPVVRETVIPNNLINNFKVLFCLLSPRSLSVVDRKEDKIDFVACNMWKV